MKNNNPDNVFLYTRRKTNVVNIGNFPMGGEYSVRVQSMTNTSTMDTDATVEQCIRIIEAGGEYVRITAQNEKEAYNLKYIKEQFRNRGYMAPIVVDVHFNPKVAEIAATLVEKVRINPGNYIDKKVFKEIEYTDEEYRDEIEKIKKRFIPFLNLCKKYNTAIRIGVNHGSLSDRIMSRYGDTPEGMAESAMEFLRICKAEDFNDVVISMKASNTRIMLYASRLVVKKMENEGMDFPLHLGVTEAGEGEDGRIKSAVGIGALLVDGIGETIRVSLTEDPEFEIPVAKQIVAYFKDKQNAEFNTKVLSKDLRVEYKRRKTIQVRNIGGNNVPVVIANFSQRLGIDTKLLEEAGWKINPSTDKISYTDFAADYIYLGKNIPPHIFTIDKGFIVDKEVYHQLKGQYNSVYPLIEEPENIDTEIVFYLMNLNNVNEKTISFLHSHNNIVICLEEVGESKIQDQKKFFSVLEENQIENPVIILKDYAEKKIDDFQLKASCDLGGFLLDGFGDGLMLRNKNIIGDTKIIETSFGILQASRVRTSKTEFISCPSCGRTNFNLQETTRMIREKTSHLKGLKIGIMGCIVNGPGEMADADYGYVGVGIGKVTLYKGKTVIKRAIPSEIAVDELIAILKENEDWVEKTT